MLLYVVFILLPATALAECDRSVYWSIFNVADKNNDGSVDCFEIFVVFTAVDVDLDGNITLTELKKRIPFVAKELEGKEAKVLEFMDHTHDKVIASDDINIEFKWVDTDCNGYKTRKEYAAYLDKYCKRLEATQASESGEGYNISVCDDAEKKCELLALYIQQPIIDKKVIHNNNGN